MADERRRQALEPADRLDHELLTQREARRAHDIVNFLLQVQRPPEVNCQPMLLVFQQQLLMTKNQGFQLRSGSGEIAATERLG
jgi:hypothetical protein